MAGGTPSISPPDHFPLARADKNEKSALILCLAAAESERAGEGAFRDLFSDPEALGKASATISCTHCHGLSGGGGIGPNLTDEEALHGGRHEDIPKVLTFGVPGRRAWAGKLSLARVGELAARSASRGSGTPRVFRSASGAC
jgi:cytochrome c oxidase cbb3-type subunit 3